MVDRFPGQPKLKNSGAVQDFTAEELIEIVRCKEDPIYFCEKYVKIVNVDLGLITFKPYEYQKKIIKSAIDERYTIVKLPRQAGKTTTMAAMICWSILFNRYYEVACLAHKESQAIEIIDRVRTVYENLPLFLQQGVVAWNKKSVELENGSLVFAAATSSGSIRGRSINLLYLDEFAIIPTNQQDDFYNSVLPTISSGQTTKIVITSTPKGFNLFWKIWNDSEKKKNDYKRIDIHWSETPGRDQEWADKQIRNTSQEQFDQEFGTEFLGSSATLIDGRILKTMSTGEPLRINSEGTLRIYAEPIDGHTYICSVDTSRGVERDYSAFSIIDLSITPYRVAATFRSNDINTFNYADMIYNLCRFYKDAYVHIETNDLGQQVADMLFYELEYENLLSSIYKRETIATMSAKNGLGLRTTTKVKRIGCANLKNLIENQQLLIDDYRTYFELTRFVNNGKGSFAAEEGEHDDMVMTLVIFAWLTTQPFFRDLTDKDVRFIIREKQQTRIEEDLLPLGMFDRGTDPVEEAVQTLGSSAFDRFLRE